MMFIVGLVFALIFGPFAVIFTIAAESNSESAGEFTALVLCWWLMLAGLFG